MSTTCIKFFRDEKKGAILGVFEIMQEQKCMAC